jgi:anti-sigma B factor antagonist
MDLTLNEYSAAPGRTVVEASGEIDVYTAPRLRETLVGLVDAGNYKLIVDLEGVEFLDSTGLGVLVGGLKRVRAHDGAIDLVCTQGRILRIFRITGLNKVFSIYGTVAEALAGAGAGTVPASVQDGKDRQLPAQRLPAERPEDQPRPRLRPERGGLPGHALPVGRDLPDQGERHGVAHDGGAVRVTGHAHRLARIMRDKDVVLVVPDAPHVGEQQFLKDRRVQRSPPL